MTATGMTPSGNVAFTASVVYKDTKEPTWVYTVATATGSPITGVDIISPHNLKNCTLKAPETLNGSTTSNADTSVVDWKIKSTTTGNPVGFSDHGGSPSVTFTISCKQQNGPTYLLVTDHAGTMTEVTTASGQSILGPIAGPNGRNDRNGLAVGTLPGYKISLLVRASRLIYFQAADLAFPICQHLIAETS